MLDGSYLNSFEKSSESHCSQELLIGFRSFADDGTGACQVAEFATEETSLSNTKPHGEVVSKSCVFLRITRLTVSRRLQETFLDTNWKAIEDICLGFQAC